MNSKKAIGAAALALMLIAGVANAQTTDYTTTGATDSTATSGTISTSGGPGVPNTGAGGSAAGNALTLATAGAVAVGGLYLLRRRII